MKKRQRPDLTYWKELVRNSRFGEEFTEIVCNQSLSWTAMMGNGFLESVYQECLEKEFIERGIPFLTQPTLRLMYKDQILHQTYKPDMICYDKIVVELKSARDISQEHKSQVINYLKATKMKLGLIINFGHYPKAQIERIIL